MKNFKELFGEWTNKQMYTGGIWTLSDVENAAFFIYEKMKEQYKNIEGAKVVFYEQYGGLQVDTHTMTSVYYYLVKKGFIIETIENDIGRIIFNPTPKQKSKEEKVKDLLNIDLTEYQWQVLEEIMKPKEL